MMGTELSSLGQDIARMINLVAFDVCDAAQVHVGDTVNPLVKEIRIPLVGPIHTDLHKHIRASVKSMSKHKGHLAGKIVLEGAVVVTIYLKRRLTPAWLRGTPQGASPDEG